MIVNIVYGIKKHWDFFYEVHYCNSYSPPSTISLASCLTFPKHTVTNNLLWIYLRSIYLVFVHKQYEVDFYLSMGLDNLVSIMSANSSLLPQTKWFPPFSLSFSLFLSLSLSLSLSLFLSFFLSYFFTFSLPFYNFFWLSGR
jgi:hypothetical protein